MTTEHLIITLVATPAVLFLLWVITVLEGEIQRVKQQRQEMRPRRDIMYTAGQDDTHYDRVCMRLSSYAIFWQKVLNAARGLVIPVADLPHLP